MKKYLLILMVGFVGCKNDAPKISTVDSVCLLGNKLIVYNSPDTFLIDTTKVKYKTKK